MDFNSSQLIFLYYLIIDLQLGKNTTIETHKKSKKEVIHFLAKNS